MRDGWSMDELLSGLDDIPITAIPAFLAQLAAAQVKLGARLLENGQAAQTQSKGGDRLLTATEAAAKTKMQRDWFYHRSKTLPFAVRLGRSVRFSEMGLDKWIRSRSGR